MLSSRYAAHVANPDRHGDLQQRHTPSLEEARAVVQLAVAIVQWDGRSDRYEMITHVQATDCWLIELIEQRNVVAKKVRSRLPPGY